MAPETVANPLCREANREELSRSLDTLREFATKTGGFAAVNTNDFSDAFDRVLDDNSQYYVLGYQPNRPGRDGEIRRIRVRVTRPGSERAVVSARSSYTFSVASARPHRHHRASARPLLLRSIVVCRRWAYPSACRPSHVAGPTVVASSTSSSKPPERTYSSPRRTAASPSASSSACSPSDRLARQDNVQPVAMDLELDRCAGRPGSPDGRPLADDARPRSPATTACGLADTLVGSKQHRRDLPRHRRPEVTRTTTCGSTASR